MRWVVKHGGSPFLTPPSERAGWFRDLWHSKRQVFLSAWMMVERQAAGLPVAVAAARLELALAKDRYNLTAPRGADGADLAGVMRCRNCAGVASVN
jgi:hypothetical protein